MDNLDRTVHTWIMGTVKFARYPGTCAICHKRVTEGTRIINTPYGWGHEPCVDAWRQRRTEVRQAMAAAAFTAAW